MQNACCRFLCTQLSVFSHVFFCILLLCKWTLAMGRLYTPQCRTGFPSIAGLVLIWIGWWLPLKYQLTVLCTFSHVALFSNKFLFNTENNQTHTLSNCEKTRERTRKPALGNNLFVENVSLYSLPGWERETPTRKHFKDSTLWERLHYYKYFYWFSNNAFHSSDELLTYRKPDYLYIIIICCCYY